MLIKWTCPACKKENLISVDLESVEGKVAKCECGKESAVNYTVSVSAKADLLLVKEEIKEAEIIEKK